MTTSKVHPNFPDFQLFDTVVKTGMDTSTKFKSSNVIHFKSKQIKSSDEFTEAPDSATQAATSPSRPSPGRGNFFVDDYRNGENGWRTVNKNT